MFALTIQTLYLVMMMMMIHDDTADSTCDMQATDDEVAEIFRKPVI